MWDRNLRTTKYLEYFPRVNPSLGDEQQFKCAVRITKIIFTAIRSILGDNSVKICYTYQECSREFANFLI